MDRRELLKVLIGASAVTLTPPAFAEWSAPGESAGTNPGHKLSAPIAGSDLPPGAVFEWLRMGEVKPAGWIREQMLRDLHQGFAGCLDKLCHEAASDIFVTNRNSMTTTNNHNEMGVNWWNGETEGNWRAGYIMMAYLAEDPQAMREADHYVQHILASQDADGYLGAFAPDSRYVHQGELWAQACLLRGLLAYAELSSAKEVFLAVRRAADLTLKVYYSREKPLPEGESHDLMFIDVLERLFDVTGDSKYRNFALWFYQQWSTSESKWDATLPSLLDLQKGFVDHGVHTYENVRVPLWLGVVTDRRDIRQASENAFVKIARYSEPSGSGVSEEMIQNSPPDPSMSEYEYCATKELQLTFASALQKSGRAEFGDRVETIWFNAAQGSRLPDGSALSYLTSDNRLRCDKIATNGKDPEKRNKFSPTHEDVAVCCNPNATQVAALYVRGMWMRHREAGLVASLYGPCSVETEIDGVTVSLEERTCYPFEHSVDVTIRPDHESEFPLYFRNPGWSAVTRIVSSGAAIQREGDYWRVTKRWKPGDTVRLDFTPEVREVPAVNGEVAIQYGPLLFAQPLASEKRSIRQYPLPHFEDSIYTPVAGLAADTGLSAAQRAKAFVPFIPEPRAEIAPRPFDNPWIELHGHLISKSTGIFQAVTLVPLGNAPLLRRLTFPVFT
ncbi:MAG: beta-L-arabinofuranosidase domain-containing protein [Terracidiphilus sp.]